MEFPEFRGQLTETVEELYREKLITPTGGNVSVRLPEEQGFLITPSMSHKGGLEPESMVLLNGDGKPVEKRYRPSIETPMHMKVYQLNPRVGAVVHTHAPFATLLGLYDIEIPPFNVEALRFASLPVVPFLLPGSRELVEGVASALDSCPGAQALLLRNHGLLTMGRDLRAAVNVSMALEEACHITITCRLLGEAPRLIPAEKRELLKKFLVV